MSTFIRSSFLFIFPFLLHVSAASAGTVPAEWTVVEASGKVEIRDGAQQPLATQPGAVLAAPFTITTGGGGRAVISHGQDRLSIGADARVGVPLPSLDDNGLVTRIRQTLGSVLYQVEHRIKDSFEVDTPYLVSVVKGTTFNIHATLEDSTVALIEGKLWVHTPDLKSEVILMPGQAAIKSHAGEAIVVKDQQALSTLRRGPITIGNGDSKSTTERAGGRVVGQTLIGAAASNSAALANPSNSVAPTTASGGSPVLDVGVGGITTGVGASAGLGIATGAASTGISVGGASTGLGVAVGAAPTGVSVGAGIGAASASNGIGSGNVANLGTAVGGTTTGLTVGGSSLISVSTTTGAASASTTAATVTATTPTVTTGVAQVPAVGGIVGNLLK